jgi:hypothetical protein
MERCPHCGYCPHCGRSNFALVPYWPQPWGSPYGPIWIYQGNIGVGGSGIAQGGMQTTTNTMGVLTYGPDN